MKYQFFDGSPHFPKTYHFDTVMAYGKRSAKISFSLRCRRTDAAWRSYPFPPILQILRLAGFSSRVGAGFIPAQGIFFGRAPGPPLRFVFDPICNEFSIVLVGSICKLAVIQELPCMRVTTFALKAKRPRQKNLG